MRRRAVLAGIGTGVAASVAGCLWAELGARVVPVDFELWNRTDIDHEAEVILREVGEGVHLDRIYQLEPPSEGDPGDRMIREEDIVEATEDTLLDIEVTLNQATNWGYRHRVTCVEGDPEPIVIAEIEEGQEYAVDFEGSVCG